MPRRDMQSLPRYILYGWLVLGGYICFFSRAACPPANWQAQLRYRLRIAARAERL